MKHLIFFLFAVAWFVAPYKNYPGEPNARYCAMDDYTAIIVADGGAWDESEINGNQAIVKVRAKQATLDLIASNPDFFRYHDTKLEGDFKDTLKQIAANRVLPRYDKDQTKIIFDGEMVPCKDIELVDKTVRDYE